MLENAPAVSSKSSTRPYRKLDAKARMRFLQALEMCGNREQSARIAGTRTETVRRYAQKNKHFNKKIENALAVFSASLECEALRRARDGYSEPIYQSGALVGFKTRYSDRLLTTLLAANIPDKYGKKTIVLEGDLNSPIALTASQPKQNALSVDSARAANDTPGNTSLELFKE